MRNTRAILLIVGIVLLSLISAYAQSYGTVNLAQGRAIAPSTNTVSGDPSYVTDGNPSTAWWSYQGNPSHCSFVRKEELCSGLPEL